MGKVSPEKNNDRQRNTVFFANFRAEWERIGWFWLKAWAFLFAPSLNLPLLSALAVSLPTLRVFPCSGGFWMIQLSTATSGAKELMMLPRSSLKHTSVFPCCQLCSQPAQEMGLALSFGFGQSFRQICLSSLKAGVRRESWCMEGKKRSRNNAVEMAGGFN